MLKRRPQGQPLYGSPPDDIIVTESSRKRLILTTTLMRSFIVQNSENKLITFSTSNIIKIIQRSAGSNRIQNTYIFSKYSLLDTQNHCQKYYQFHTSFSTRLRRRWLRLASMFSILNSQKQIRSGANLRLLANFFQTAGSSISELKTT